MCLTLLDSNTGTKAPKLHFPSLVEYRNCIKVDKIYELRNFRYCDKPLQGSNGSIHARIVNCNLYCAKNSTDSDFVAVYTPMSDVFCSFVQISM